MKSRLAFASVFTLGLLLAFVGTILAIIMYATHRIDWVALVALTVLINVASWIFSPYIQDLILRWFYKAETLEWPEFQSRWPNVAIAVERTCTRNKIPLPRIRIIDDGNPTAYCFGSGTWNARLVTTTGLFNYCNEEEVIGVFSHELGHIYNGDFILMTLAATLLTLLYETYVILSSGKQKRGGSSDARSRLAWAGYLAYIMYIVGTYLVLYLSRTREYLADRFSAEQTRNPNALAMALVKVAYGIAAAPDSAKSKRLLASTRALGICDYRTADTAGSAYARFVTGGGGTAVEADGAAAAPSRAPQHVERVFLFDLFNPWATIGELNSTHPLTGKRVQRLMEYAKQSGMAPCFDFSMTEYEGQMLDRGRMRRNFAREVLIYFAPHIGFVLGIVCALVSAPGAALAAPLLGLGLGWSLQGLYRYPSGAAEPTSVFDLMCDPYASPVRGRLVYLDGTVIGRAAAGNPVGEDVMLQDQTGFITLNYESWLPIIGNLWFGWRTVKRLMDQHVSAVGWFRRYTRAYVDLNSLESTGGRYESYTRFWGLYRGPLFIAFALLVMAGLAR